MALLKATTNNGHGGARPGSGPKTIFGGSKALTKPIAMDFTPRGRRELARLVKRTGLSRNAVIGWLALRHADALSYTDAMVFPGKARDVLSIRLPREAAAKLAAARVRTGRSYSDIGEALVRGYGPAETFPQTGP